jgi:hypothetical protein
MGHTCPGINAKPYLENNQSKRAGGIAQVVEHLGSKCETLSSNPSTAKNISKLINKYIEKQVQI